MKAFRFRLEKVLSWRDLQMRAEEEKLAALQKHQESILQRINAIFAAELKAKAGVAKRPDVSGSDLQALTPFLSKIERQRAVLTAEKLQCDERIATQRTRVLKAQRDFRALEKLRERRLEEWTQALDQETENAAADAHLSKLIRGEP